MTNLQLKEKIIDAIKKTIKHISKQSYWNDINSFSLYTDESYMSLALLFNTNSYYNSVKEEDEPLTYLFTPAEWFSENISDDEILYKNIYFSEITKYLVKESLNTKDFELYKNKVENACLQAMEYCIENNIFSKSRDTIYLFMLSDDYDEDNIYKNNIRLNSEKINKKLKKWLKDEL